MTDFSSYNLTPSAKEALVRERPLKSYRCSLNILHLQGRAKQYKIRNGHEWLVTRGFYDSFRISLRII